MLPMRAWPTGVQIGITPSSGRLKIILIDSIRSPKHRQGLMAGGLHRGEGIHPSPPKIRRRGMAHVMEHEILNPGVPAHRRTGLGVSPFSRMNSPLRSTPSQVSPKISPRRIPL